MFGRVKPLDAILATAEKKALHRSLGWFQLTLLGIGSVIGTGIFVLIVLIAIGQVAINRWNEPFYDALARKDLQAFFQQLMVFFGIAGTLLVLNVAQT